jgi:hypothetical protein
VRRRRGPAALWAAHVYFSIHKMSRGGRRPLNRSSQLRGSTASPACAGSHGYQAVEECTAGVLRSLGEGGHASAGSAEVSKGTTAVKLWGSTFHKGPKGS